jgi:hypothetical protein
MNSLLSRTRWGNRVPWRGLTVACCLATCLPAAPAAARRPPPGDPVVFAQVPADRHAGDREDVGVPPGSRIVALDPARPGQDVVVLTSGFTAAGHPDVSFDGRRILFVGRRAESEPLEVWEMNADGTAPRRVAPGVGGCRAAIYLGRMFTIDAERPVARIAVDRETAEGRSLWACGPDGTGLRQITFTPLGAADPCQLSDGRVLFSSGRPPDSTSGRSDGSVLFTVHADGTDVFPFAAAHDRPAVRGMACETPGGQVVFVESAGGDGGGRLVAVSRTASLHTRRIVADDPAGLYRSPQGLGDGRLLVSHRPRHGGTWGLYVLDPEADARAVVHDDPAWHDVDAVPLAARREPAGRSSVVDDRADTGLLYCLDAALSDRSPCGTRREIRALEVFRPGAGEQPIGTVPVEADGSFHLRVPARTPLRLRTIDAEGRVVDAMRSWIWVMPNEARGCIGCHEDRELSPPNRHVLALRKPPRDVGSAPEPVR